MSSQGDYFTSSVSKQMLDPKLSFGGRIEDLLEIRSSTRSKNAHNNILNNIDLALLNQGALFEPQDEIVMQDKTTAMTEGKMTAAHKSTVKKATMNKSSAKQRAFVL